MQLSRFKWTRSLKCTTKLNSIAHSSLMRMIGVNNRSLATFETDLATTERLAARLPKDRLLISESGIYTHADIERLQRTGARAFLVGESLMREADVAAATRRLLGH